MRRESLYLTDIVEAADHIAEFIAGADFQTFQKSEMLRSAVVQKALDNRRGGCTSFRGIEGSQSPDALASDHSLPQHSCACVVRDRLGSGLAGRRKSLPRITGADRGHS